MIKDIDIDAPLEILNKVEATGLPCKWTGSELNVTVDDEKPDDLLKLALALQGSKRVRYTCVRMKLGIYELVEARKFYGKHATGWVILRNGHPEFHGDLAEASRIIRSVTINHQNQ